MDKGQESLYRKELRKKGIAARDALSREQREILSQAAAENILHSSEFKGAKNVMIYNAVRGEVSLSYLISKAADKRLVYPLCIEEHKMLALLPGEGAWQKGSYGIREPVLESSRIIAPEDIDMLICPCTVFDERGGRMGMGGGYYDRFLPLCVNALVSAVAFEVQKTPRVPMESWDRGMDIIFTEKHVYRRN